MTDSAGQSAAALLYYVSPAVVNFVVPPGLANGAGTVTVKNDSASSSGNVSIYAAAPALYSADQTGSGFAAALVTGGSGYSTVAQCTAANCTPNPIDVSGGPVYLSLYGTGIRGGASVSVVIGNVAAPVQYAGAQGAYAGLDQINVQIPAALKGRGRLSVIATAGGQQSNPVWITVQ